MKKNKITDSIFIERHFCSCRLLYGRSGEQWQLFPDYFKLKRIMFTIDYAEVK